MSPDMLTLVAAVLVYDRALDSVLDNALLLSSRTPSRKVRSETRDEKDMIQIKPLSIRLGEVVRFISFSMWYLRYVAER